MDTGLSISMLVDNVGVSPTPAKPTGTPNTNQFAAESADGIPSTITHETSTTDNIGSEDETQPTKPTEFSQTFRRELTTTQPPQTPPDAESKVQNTPPDTPGKQDVPAGVAEQPAIVQSWLADNSKIVEQSKEGVATRMESKAGRLLAELLADLKAGEFGPVTPQAAKPTATKASQMVPAAPQLENNPLQVATSQSQIALKAVSPDTSSGPLTADAQLEEVKSMGKKLSNQTLLASIPTPRNSNGGSAKELTPAALADSGTKTTTPAAGTLIADDKTATDGGTKTSTTATGTLIADDKTATDGEKPAMVDKPFLSDDPKATVLKDSLPIVDSKSSDSQQQIPLAPKKPTLISEKPTVADKPFVSDDPKATVLKDGLPIVDSKSSDSQQQIPLAPKKSALITKEPINNIADPGQRGQILSESSADNGKKQVGNFLGDSILKNLDPAQVHISSNQTKDGGNSSSNNDNSDQGFEQILSASNAQTFITEQSSASASAGKTNNNASLSDVPTSVSEQIQESIHSSLRQGDQQITIRLNPPELGKVFIKFQEQEQQIIGILEVSKAQTRAEIQQVLPQIIQTLQNSGVQVKRLEVVLTNEQEQHAFKDQSLQDGWSEQQSSANPNSQGNNPDWIGTNEWLTDDSSYAGLDEPQGMLITDNRINMLI